MDYHSREKTRSPSPELSQFERDKRTVFVSQLAARVKTSEIAEFFKAAGRVRDVKLISDKYSRKSKGYADFFSVA
jgi:RNA-binding protein 39